MVSQNMGLIVAAVAAGGLYLATRNKEPDPDPGSPLLTVFPASIDFGAINTGESPLVVLTLENAGGGTLQWSISSLPSWLTATPTSGSGPGSVTLAVASFAPIGMLSGTVEFTSTGGSASVPVVVDVGGGAIPLVVSVTIIPDNAAIEVGQGQLYAATAHFDDGGALNVTDQAIWSTPDPDIAFVTGNLATGVNPGIATIEASFDGVVGAVTLEVVAMTPVPTVTGLTLQPAAATIEVGEMLTYSSIAGLSDGTVQDVSLLATFTVQAISGFPVASISSNVATGASPGSAVVTAAFGGLTTDAGLTVVPAPTPGPVVVAMRVEPAAVTIEVGGAFALQAIATMDDGEEVNVTVQAGTLWGSSDPSIATVRQDGIVEGVAAGSTFINASLEGFAGVTEVTVVEPSPPPPEPEPTVTAMSVTPTNPGIEEGTNFQMKATATMSDGLEVDVTSGAGALWGSSNSAIATVTQSGRISGIASGQTFINASLDGFVGVATVTVFPAGPGL